MLDSFLNMKVIEIRQPIGNLYIGKVDGNLLYKMAKADIRRITREKEYKGMQRELDKARVKLIKRYIKTFDASFPNSIILSLDSKYIVENSGEELVIKITDKTFTIIDGQHRLAGFEEGYNNHFDLVVSIFIDIEEEEQAILFKTINSEQRKVDPSLTYDLESYSTVKSPRKFVRDIALAFNMDRESPWYTRIKMIGRKDSLSENGSITLKAFVEPILNYIYPDEKDYYEIREKLKEYQSKIGTNEFSLKEVFGYNDYDSNKYFLWSLYVDENKELMYKILFNYYKAIYKILKKEWENKKSILTKTMGYNALMYLFNDIFKHGLKSGNFKQEYFEKLLKPLQEIEKYDSKTFGASSEYAARGMYQRMKREINL